MKSALSLSLILLAGCNVAPSTAPTVVGTDVDDFVERLSTLALRRHRDGDLAAAIATWEAVRLVAPGSNIDNQLRQLQEQRLLSIGRLETQLRTTSTPALRRSLSLEILALDGSHEGAIDTLRNQELQHFQRGRLPGTATPEKPPASKDLQPAQRHLEPVTRRNTESLLVAEIESALQQQDLNLAHALFARDAHNLAGSRPVILEQLARALHAHGRALLRVDLEQGIIWLRRANEVTPNNARLEAELRAALRMQDNLKRIRNG